MLILKECQLSENELLINTSKKCCVKNENENVVFKLNQLI